MKTCASIEDQLMDFLYEELPPGQRAAIEEHLSSCPQCMDQLVEFQQTRARFSRLPEVRPSPAVTIRILEEAHRQAVLQTSREAAEPVSFLSRLPAWVLTPAMGTAVAVVLVVGAFYLLRTPEQIRLEQSPRSLEVTSPTQPLTQPAAPATQPAPGPPTVHPVAAPQPSNNTVDYLVAERVRSVAPSSLPADLEAGANLRSRALENELRRQEETTSAAARRRPRLAYSQSGARELAETAIAVQPLEARGDSARPPAQKPDLDDQQATHLARKTMELSSREQLGAGELSGQDGGGTLARLFGRGSAVQEQPSTPAATAPDLAPGPPGSSQREPMEQQAWAPPPPSPPVAESGAALTLASQPAAAESGTMESKDEASIPAMRSVAKAKVAGGKRAANAKSALLLPGSEQPAEVADRTGGAALDQRPVLVAKPGQAPTPFAAASPAPTMAPATSAGMSGLGLAGSGGNVATPSASGGLVRLPGGKAYDELPIQAMAEPVDMVNREENLLQEGRNHRRTGRYQQALQVFQQLKQTGGERYAEQSQLELAQTLVQMGRKAEAVEAYEAFLRQFPRSRRSGPAMMTLVNLYNETGRPDMAQQTLGRYETWDRAERTRDRSIEAAKAAKPGSNARMLESDEPAPAAAAPPGTKPAAEPDQRLDSLESIE